MPSLPDLINGDETTTGGGGCGGVLLAFESETALNNWIFSILVPIDEAFPNFVNIRGGTVGKGLWYLGKKLGKCHILFITCI